MSTLQAGPRLLSVGNEENRLLQEIDQHHQKVIGTLNLFSPDESHDVKADFENVAILERPVTPLQDEIKSAPTQLDSLQELVRRRIQPVATNAAFSVEQQREIAGIIMGEVNGCWRDIRQQIDYPFFNEAENHELNRRIALHVVTVCEQLFHHFSSSSQERAEKRVFTSEANFARMKIQLSLDARKFLNPLAIRRHICEDMKQAKARAEATKHLPRESCVYPDMSQSPADIDLEAESNAEGHQASAADGKAAALNFKSLLNLSRPTNTETRPVYKSDREMLIEMQQSLAIADTQQVLQLVRSLPQPNAAAADGDAADDVDAASESTYSALNVEESTSARGHHELEAALPKSVAVAARSSRERPESARELLARRRLADELDVDPAAGEKLRSHEADEKLLRSCKTRQQQQRLQLGAKDINSLTADALRDDLQRLADAGKDSALKRGENQMKGQHEEKEEKEEEEEDDEDDELPALVQATLKLRKEGGRLQELMRKIDELDAKAKKAADAEFYEPPQPTHPQPQTVTSSFGNSTVRLSDIRPPERRCMSRVTLNSYAPVWNDLVGDIDADTVKELDSGLFKGQEIREVYEEILKTVDQSHLDFTADPLIEACPDELSLSSMLASSSLYRRKRQRVTNEKLRRAQSPPWRKEGQQPRDWAKPNIFAPGDKKGVVNLSGVHDNFVAKEVLAEADAERQKAAQRQEVAPRRGSRAPPPRYALPLSDFRRHVQDMPKAVQERVLRSYSAWMSQWKEEVGSDDFMRFLATQETDYLGLMFHMFDSEDDEDEELLERQRLQEEKKQRDAKRRQQLEELLKQKTEFSPGFWNIRTITMGGLGRDPDLVDSDIQQEQQEVQQKQLSGEEQSMKAKKKPTIAFKTRHSSGTAAVRSRSDVEASAAAEAAAAAAAAARSTTKLQLNRSVQDRLETIWKQLRFPDNQRLDMAIKYCKIPDIDEALDAWERAAATVLQREAIVAELEQFERDASDPDRFFARGERGSSKARIEESRLRQQLYDRLQEAEVAARKEVELLLNNHNDTVTYCGRPYAEKMKWDRTEMLYWLHEERRLTKSRASPILPPICSQRD